MYQKPPGAEAAQPTEPGTAPQMKETQRGPIPKDMIAGFLTRDKVFSLDSREQLIERITRELMEEDKMRGSTSPADYYRAPPATPVVPAGTPYVPKTVSYPPVQLAIEPGYVVHRRLYFEELNSERYGWDLGVLSPAVSTFQFYKDTLLWPARLGTNLFERYDTSAGKCLPGSPVPYYLYPPGVDLFGATLGAGTIVGVAAIFP